MMVVGRTLLPLLLLLQSPCFTAGRLLSSLSRGVDVQLTLQDVVDDGLTQVVHNMAVTVLQRQSVGGETDGVKVTLSTSFSECSDFSVQWEDFRFREYVSRSSGHILRTEQISPRGFYPPTGNLTLCRLHVFLSSLTVFSPDLFRFKKEK